MSIFFQYIVPIGFFAFFLFQLKKSPIYACGVPMVFAFGEAIYLPLTSMTLSIPGIPKTIGKEDIVFLLLAIVWFYIRQKRPNCQRLVPGLDLAVVGLFLGYLFLEILVGWLQTGVMKVGGSTGRLYFYFPFSFFLWVDILRRFTRNEVWQLLGNVSAMTAFLMVLYCLSSVGVEVYSQPKYQTLYVGSHVVVRDYVTFPYWTKLAIAFYLISFFQGRNKYRVIAALGTLIAGTALSLTRSYLFPVSVMLVMMALYSFSRFRGIKRVRGAILIVCAVIGISVFLKVYSPSNIDILKGRIIELRTSDFRETNLGSRFETFRSMRYFMVQLSPLFGIGFTQTPGHNLDDVSDVILGDMMWLSFFLILGWIGIVGLAVILITAFWSSLKLARNQDLTISQIGLLLAMIMVWDIGRTFTSEGFLWFIAMGTLPLAMITVEMRALWSNAPVTVALPKLSFSLYEDNWLGRHDRYFIVRRLLFFALMAFIAYSVGMLIAAK